MAEDFKRAHGEEQKAVRVDQIVSAALDLYDQIGYDKITFSKLAQGLGFSRINLYNYFRTKEELFLEVVRREYELLADDMARSLPTEPCEMSAYVDAWTDVAARHGRAFEMFVLMNMQILHHVEPARANEFQAYLDAMVSRLANRAATCLALADDKAWSLVAHQLNYAMGLFPIVLRMFHGDKASQAFAQTYREFLTALIAGLSG